MKLVKYIANWDRKRDHKGRQNIIERKIRIKDKIADNKKKLIP